MHFVARSRRALLGALIVASFIFAIGSANAKGQAATTAKPNILFVMGDDIGWMQVGAYHCGLSLGETPNIDRIGKEGAIFMQYYARQSCTSGRNACFTGMYPPRTGMIPPQLPGSPTYLLPGTRALAVLLAISVIRRDNLARTTWVMIRMNC